MFIKVSLKDASIGGTYFISGEIHLNLTLPPFYSQAELFPATSRSYSQVLFVSAVYLQDALHYFGIDKILLKATRAMIVGIGEKHVNIENPYGKKRYIASPVLFFNTMELSLYRYCDNTWVKVAIWNGQQFSPPIEKLPGCPKKNVLTFFVAYWAFMGYEEIFLLLLVSRSLNMNINVIFPRHECYGLRYSIQGFLPNTFKDSYIWPLQYINTENIPLTFELKSPNVKVDLWNGIGYEIDDIDIIGGSIRFGLHMRHNPYSLEHNFAYEMTLAFENRAPYPVVRQPVEIQHRVNYFNTFDASTWVLLTLGLLIMTSLLLLAIKVNGHGKQSGLYVLIPIHLIFGFIRPSEFKANLHKPTRGESMLIFFWFLFAMFIHILYNTDFRSALIGQEFEKPIKDYNSSNPFKVQFAFFASHGRDVEHYSGVTNIESALRDILRENKILADHWIDRNVIDNDALHRIVISDFMQQSKNHLMVFNEYDFLKLASWYEKRRETMFLLKSSISTVKFKREYDYVWILPKHHTYSAAIDYSIKVIHQMGLLRQFKIPLRHNPDSNPYKNTQAEDAGEQVSVTTLKPFFNVMGFLFTGIAIYFLQEYFDIKGKKFNNTEVHA